MTDLTVEKLNLREAEMWGEDHYSDGTARFYEWSQPFLRELFTLAKEALTAREDGGWRPISELTYQSAQGRILLIRAPSLVHADWNPEGTAQATLVSDEPGDVLCSVKWDGSHDCWDSVDVSDATHFQLMPLPPPPTEQTEGEET